MNLSPYFPVGNQNYSAFLDSMIVNATTITTTCMGSYLNATTSSWAMPPLVTYTTTPMPVSVITSTTSGVVEACTWGIRTGYNACWDQS